jgi:hypothetical protein
MNCRYRRRWPRVASERDRRAGLIEGRENILNRREMIYRLTAKDEGLLAAGVGFLRGRHLLDDDNGDSPPRRAPCDRRSCGQTD